MLLLLLLLMLSLRRLPSCTASSPSVRWSWPSAASTIHLSRTFLGTLVQSLVMCFNRLLGLAWLAENCVLQCLHFAPGRFAVALLPRVSNSDRMGAGGRPPLGWKGMSDIFHRSRQQTVPLGSSARQNIKTFKYKACAS
jgi:hypothetical protein